jgi:hypothetical protein
MRVPQWPAPSDEVLCVFEYYDGKRCGKPRSDHRSFNPNGGKFHGWFPPLRAMKGENK